jgi:hypothetical protein
MMPADDEVTIRLAPSHATNRATPPDADQMSPIRAADPLWALLIGFFLACYFFFQWLADKMCSPKWLGLRLLVPEIEGGDEFRKLRDAHGATLDPYRALAVRR